MRWIRLVIGLFSTANHTIPQFLLGFVAAFFLFYSIFNTGCGLNGCKVATFKKSKMNSREYHKSEKPVLD
jgi:hypothetical protein